MDEQNTTERPRRELYQAGDAAASPVSRNVGSVQSPRPSSESLNFSEALHRLKSGERVARAGWNGRGQFIELQVPDRQSKMTLPYIFIRTVQDDLVPWLASQTDLLACDWCVVREAKVLVYGDSPTPA